MANSLRNCNVLECITFILKRSSNFVTHSTTENYRANVAQHARPELIPVSVHEATRSISTLP